MSAYWNETVGELSTSQCVALASASKLVTGLVLLRVPNDPAVDFALEDTTEQARVTALLSVIGHH